MLTGINNRLKQWRKSRLTASQQAALKRYLSRRGQSGSKLSQLSGSSEAGIFACGRRVYKVEFPWLAQNNYSAYQNFALRLGDEYRNYFPEIKAPEKSSRFAIWEIEFVPGVSFEHLILNGGSNLAGCNRELLRFIVELADKTAISETDSLMAFLREILETTRINLSRAGILEKSNFSALAEMIERKRCIFSSSAKASLIHRDLTVGNIMVYGQEIKLIDPRTVIPYGGRNYTVYGNTAWDLAGYLISLERKNAELSANNKPDISALISDANLCASELRDMGYFNDHLWRLCRLAWFGVYAACRCDYCLSPERRWLYDSMKNNLHDEIMNLEMSIL
jgi:hypothetical protein